MLEIAPKDIVARLKFDNSWWDGGLKEEIAYQEEPRRKYFPSFHKMVTDSSVRRATVLMGPRRVGKTVMVYHCIRALLDSGVQPNEILYVSLETPIYTGLSLERLIGFFQEQFGHGRNAKVYIFFDEIQYLKDWEVHLKSLVDSYGSYRFVATGSAAAALRLKSNESGAGRFSDFMLPPLTFAEYLMFIGRENELLKAVLPDTDNVKYATHYSVNDINALNQEFINYLNFGGYPEAVFSETVRTNSGQYIKSDIIDKVLLRDLPSLYGINDIQELNRLFTTLAYNTGNEVSFDGLSQSSGVAINTVRRYIEYLEAAFLIKRVERIDRNAKRFKRAANFKVYLINPSMWAALFGRVDENSEAMGALAETAIFSQWQHGESTSLFYARWGSGEVDVVYLDSVNQMPKWISEIKWSDRPYRITNELDNLVHFANEHPQIMQPILVSSKTVDDTISYRDIQFHFRPVSLHAYILGASLLRRLN